MTTAVALLPFAASTSYAASYENISAGVNTNTAISNTSINTAPAVTETVASNSLSASIDDNANSGSSAAEKALSSFEKSKKQPLIKPYTAVYKVKAEADGELRKKLSYQDNTVKLESVLKASTFFVDVTVKQQAQGELGAKGLVPKSLVVSNSRQNDGKPKAVYFEHGEGGNLSAIYKLRYSLLKNDETIPEITMLRKNKYQTLNFKIISRTENVETNLGNIISTKVVATDSNGDELAYYFANDNAKYNGVLDKMTVTNSDGDQELVAVLNTFHMH